MPKPVFIICCQSLSIDKATNFASFFHVLEGFTMTIEAIEEMPSGLSESQAAMIRQNAIQAPSFFVIAQWMKDSEDKEDDEYGYEFGITSPGEDRIAFGSGLLVFEKMFYRNVAQVQKMSAWTQSGTCWIDCTLTNSRTKGRIVQQFPLPIVVRNNTALDDLAAALATPTAPEQEDRRVS